MFNTSREPAAYAEAARLAVAALVGLGWVSLDNNTVNAIVTAVGALASIVLTIAVRQHVTPVSVPPAPLVESPHRPAE